MDFLDLISETPVWVTFDRNDVVEIHGKSVIANIKWFDFTLTDRPTYRSSLVSGVKVRAIHEDTNTILFYGEIDGPVRREYEKERYATRGYVLKVSCKEDSVSLARSKYNTDDLPVLAEDIDLATLFSNLTAYDVPDLLGNVEVFSDQVLKYREALPFPPDREMSVFQAIQQALKSGSTVYDESNASKSRIFDFRVIPNLRNLDDVSNTNSKGLIYERGSLPLERGEGNTALFSGDSENPTNPNSYFLRREVTKNTTPSNILTQVNARFSENGILQDTGRYDVVRFRLKRSKYLAFDLEGDIDLYALYQGLVHTGFDSKFYVNLTKEYINSGAFLTLNREVPIADVDERFNFLYHPLFTSNIPPLADRTFGSYSQDNLPTIIPTVPHLPPLLYLLDPELNPTPTEYTKYWYDILLGTETDQYMRFKTAPGSSNNVELKLITMLSRGALTAGNDSGDDKDTIELWGLVEIVSGKGGLIQGLNNNNFELNHVDEDGNNFGFWFGDGRLTTNGRVLATNDPGNLVRPEGSLFSSNNMVLRHSTDSGIFTGTTPVVPTNHPLRSFLSDASDYKIEITRILSSEAPNVISRPYNVSGAKLGINQKLPLNLFVSGRLPSKPGTVDTDDRVETVVRYSNVSG